MNDYFGRFLPEGDLAIVLNKDPQPIEMIILKVLIRSQVVLKQ
jgi:hypothetical protein